MHASSPLPFLAAAVLSLAWAGFVVAVTLGWMPPGSATRVADLLALVTPLAILPVLAFAVAAAWSARRGAAGPAVGAATPPADGWEEAEARLAGAAARLGALAQSVQHDVAALDAATASAREGAGSVAAAWAQAAGDARDGQDRAAAAEGAARRAGEAVAGLSAAWREGAGLLDEAGHAADRTETKLAAVAGALPALAEQAFALDRRLDEVGRRLSAATSLMGPLTDRAATLEASAARAERQLEALGARLQPGAQAARALADSMAGAAAAAAGLGEPLARQRTDAERLAAALEQQKHALSTAGQALVVEVEQAREIAAEVERLAADTALRASGELVDAMARLRDLTREAEGRMKSTLAAVAGEAREGLEQAMAELAATRVVQPVTAAMAEAGEAARLAAERSAAAMRALVDTMQRLDERVEGRQAALEGAVQEDLRARAGLLLDRLDQAGLGLAAALGQPMSDEDWRQWRGGERRRFARRTRTLLDRTERRALAARLAADAALDDAARRYLADFEALVARLDAAAPGRLGTLLRDSDTGRLAAALAEALGAGTQKSG